MAFKFGDVSTPDGESGDWRVSTMELTDDMIGLSNLRAIRDGNPEMLLHPGTYVRLTCKGRGVVMSNTPMEVRTAFEAYENATGRVLVIGLGLGMVLEGILSKPDVTFVRVVEREPDVIALVGPTFAGDPRVEIVEGDAFEYKPAKGERFDYVWHDIWDTISSENLEEMRVLVRRVPALRRPAGRVVQEDGATNETEVWMIDGDVLLTVGIVVAFVVSMGVLAFAALMPMDMVRGTSELEQRAKSFAALCHAGQRRKYTGEPYTVHLAAVAELVRAVPHTEEMVAAAWLHDVVEDTVATIDEVRRVFGSPVAELVDMLTDISAPEDGSRAARKALDRAHLSRASADAKTIKLADVIDNSRDIAEHDPHFASVYLKEKAALLDVLVEGDPVLLAEARRIVHADTSFDEWWRSNRHLDRQDAGIAWHASGKRQREVDAEICKNTDGDGYACAAAILKGDDV